MNTARRPSATVFCAPLLLGGQAPDLAANSLTKGLRVGSADDGRSLGPGSAFALCIGEHGSPFVQIQSAQRSVQPLVLEDAPGRLRQYVHLTGDQVVQRQAAQICVQGEHAPVARATAPQGGQLPVKRTSLGSELSQRVGGEVPAAQQRITPTAQGSSRYGFPPSVAAWEYQNLRGESVNLSRVRGQSVT